MITNITWSYERLEKCKGLWKAYFTLFLYIKYFETVGVVEYFSD